MVGVIRRRSIDLEQPEFLEVHRVEALHVVEHARAVVVEGLEQPVLRFRQTEQRRSGRVELRIGVAREVLEAILLAIDQAARTQDRVVRYPGDAAGLSRRAAEQRHLLDHDDLGTLAHRRDGSAARRGTAADAHDIGFVIPERGGCGRGWPRQGRGGDGQTGAREQLAPTDTGRLVVLVRHRSTRCVSPRTNTVRRGRYSVRSFVEPRRTQRRAGPGRRGPPGRPGERLSRRRAARSA